METKVSVAGEPTQIQVSNVLRLGCVLVPTMFLLYFNMVSSVEEYNYVMALG